MMIAGKFWSMIWQGFLRFNQIMILDVTLSFFLILGFLRF